MEIHNLFNSLYTGGGKFLSSLSPLPKHTYATEAYISNIQVVRNRLESLGVKVYEVKEVAIDELKLKFINLCKIKKTIDNYT